MRLKMVAGISNWPLLEPLYDSDFNIYHDKEYTLEELEQLLRLPGFCNIEGRAFEVFFHKSLKKMGRLQAMGADRSTVSQFGRGFNFLHPYEYARLAALLITWLVPKTRSDIMVVGQK